MGFWDNVKAAASDAIDSKGGDIGNYLDSVVTGVFATVKQPTAGNETKSSTQVKSPASAAVSSDYMKYIMIAGVLVIGAVVLSQSRKA